MTPHEFINRWQQSGAAERANYTLFLTELCQLLDVPPPEPSRDDDADNAYVFERNVHFPNDNGTHTIGRIDLYKRGAFVLEAKQGSDAATAEEQAARALLPAAAKKSKKVGTAVRGTAAWDDAMYRAKNQAERYAKALPATEGWPPFLIVVDVGHTIELYSEFSRSGKAYVPFPDPQSYRLALADLAKDDVRAVLKKVWLDPLTLDPSRRAAKVTRELAQRLAELAKLLEKAKHDPEDVAKFLMRSLFTMFAEDVELIPRGSFKDLLAGLRDEPENFKPAAEDLWRTMNTGGFSPILRKQLLRFNGGLFAESEALPLTRPMLELLHEAAGADWTDVEPAIFGTLLERALDPVERHKLGAHYTPRAYVERLVLPTVIEPLRDDWQAVFVAAVTAAKSGDLAEAQQQVRAFHDTLCHTRVLDPACGSGNFLYVTLEQMKRLEGEVLNALRDFGDKQSTLLEVDPHQFLGIEVNPRAAAIADLVLWIGFLQWHFRTRGKAQLAEPIIKNYKNIECRDAVLAWDSREPVLDAAGQPVTRWDGRTMKRHPVTGEDVPDDTARIPVERYINPRKADWPAAEFVVGNPPFIGASRMREALGDAYTLALRDAYQEVPDSADFVMYWWDKAAVSTSQKSIRRFGFIATNSIKQSFNRRILDKHLTGASPISIRFAIPDHPWVESSDGAAVRISMTIASAATKKPGLLLKVSSEHTAPDGNTHVELATSTGLINSNLTIGTNSNSAVQLISNQSIAIRGVCLVGEGFVITPQEAEQLGLNIHAGLKQHLRKYLNGRDVTARSRNAMVIDLQGLTADEVQKKYPEVFQWILERVKPERDQNREEYRRINWWVFGRRHTDLRAAINGMNRHIATPMTAKHRMFVFLDGDTLPDQGLVSIAIEDALYLGILSSKIHVLWSLVVGGTLEDRPRYNQTLCFEPFPFPICTDAQKSRIRELGEQLDAHRKRQQALHPKLTLTDMYNVLEKLRAGDVLSAKDKTIHEQGLVSVLRQIHDDLDAAVFDAYGWPPTLTDDEILERLVALNAERAEEERNGIIRWLRPEFQNPPNAAKQQGKLALTDEEDDETDETTPRRGKKAKPAKAAAKASKAKPAAKQPWPKERAAQVKSVLAAHRAAGGSVTVDKLAKHFVRAPKETIAELLQALTTLGQLREVEPETYAE